MYLGCADTDDPEPPTVGLTSMLKRVDVAIYETIKSCVENTFEAGVHVFTLANGGIGFEINEDLYTLPEPVLTAVNELKQDIIDGVKTPPTTL